MLVEQLRQDSPLEANLQRTRRRSEHRITSLDGLRGVAIIAVILFHAQIGFLISDPGVRHLAAVFRYGWVGVDVFFVLSGFLITGILLDTRPCRNYFSAFFARRILRIFPLYYFVLLCVFVGIPWVIGSVPATLQMLFNNQSWFWSYSSNIGYVVQRRAFGNADWLWLDHFWSLAVEEQFYLVWPFAVRFLTGSRLRTLCLMLIVGSLGIRCILAISGMRPGALYFPTICRLDGLAAGAIAALEIRSPTFLSSTRCRQLLMRVSTAGLFTICLIRNGFYFDDYWCLTFGLTLIAIVSSLIVFTIAASNDDTTMLPTVLKSPMLCFFGKYSYGMYVLHHLLMPIVFWQLPSSKVSQWSGGPLGAAFVTTFLIFMISTLSAVLSWHLLESRFLSFKRHFEYRDESSQQML